MTDLACTCGRVHLRVERTPIIATECFCTSCRTAGEQLGALQGAPTVVGDTGGTRFVLYRKDRVVVTSGSDLLREVRLKPDSPTRRVVASCCNTPVFLEFQHGHWLSLYAGLWPEGEAPEPQVRTMVGDLPAGAELGEGAPHGRGPTLGFYRKLLGAWIAMGFKSPKVAVNGTLKT